MVCSNAERLPRGGLVVALWLACVLPCAGEDQQETAAELDTLLTAYFTEPDQDERAGTAARITELADGDVELVGQAVGKLQLWSDQPPGLSRLEVNTGEDRVLPVDVLVPQGYDATKRYPLILGLHGARGRGRHVIGYLQVLLGDRLDDYIVAAPTGYKAPTLRAALEDADEPLSVLAAVRRRYHVDSSRVYALGYSMGGHGAFGLATLYGDQFAAAIPLAGTLIVYYPQGRAIMLSNLINTPVFACWGSEDKFDDRGKAAYGGGVAGVNRALLGIADELDVPLRGRVLRGVGHSDVRPPLELVMSYLEMQRDPTPGRVSHWFRYPVQGRSSWLRQSKFAGKPWQGTELTIVTRLGQDFDKYVTDTIKRKLAYIGGHIEGQHIEVKTRRTAETHILLNDSLINLDQAIVLKLNGKVRYQGRVERKIATLLEEAYAEWDFQRLYSVRLVAGRRSMARQD